MIEARAAITDGFGKLWVDTVEEAPPGPDEVLVQLKAAGVCHTDSAFEATAITSLGAAPLARICNGGTAVRASGIEEDLTINMRRGVNAKGVLVME